MKEVTIGPKKHSAKLPMGKVSEQVAQKIDAATEGKLGKQMLTFDVRISEEDINGIATYSRACALNGANAFKRYNKLDVLMYKTVQFIKKAF